MPKLATALLAALLLFLSGQPAQAATCTPDITELHVSGASQCLVMRRFGSDAPEVMVIWLHGDLSTGGPANYQFAAAEAATKELGGNVASIALVRPGYPDGSGNESTVAFSHSGRADHYTRENVTEVGTAIERLRERFRPRLVLVVGHSGGAATAAILLGLKPRLMDGAVLVSCPCDTVAWRSGRRAWSRSENPMAWAGKVDAGAKVVALTGARDDNTAPDLARSYIDALAQRGINASFRLLPDDTHNSAFRSPEVLRALQGMIAAS
ncbi:alpha/beta hydrolase family protein [Cupriavidus sp. 2TAF22]|uniref:alpha/beta hydrolase family protein n=1 Tax=unclassified Cupriavidus TaxID=2640874 RepID=UPI003F8DACC3